MVKKIGILTSGGDCAGLNAVIRAATLRAINKYKWEINAGYGTKDHIAAIKKYGVTKFHRKTFKPIHNILSLK